MVGTSVGAGMLGLPVETAHIGFMPVCASYVLCFAIMTLSAMLFLELQVKMKAGGNISSMAYSTLGKGAAKVVEGLFAVLYYSLLIAYLKAFTHIVSNAYPHIHPVLNAVIAISFFGGCIFFKKQAINKINAGLVVGLVLAYAFITIIGFTRIRPQAFLAANWQNSVFSMPLIMTAFGFHVIIPSLYHYQGEDPVTTRFSILAGTTVTLLIYLIWQAVITGVVPLHALIDAHRLDQTAVIPMSRVLDSRFLPVLGQLFGFFALASSCLGVSIAFYDFAVDKLSISISRGTKLGLLLLIFIPPLVVVSAKIQIFYLALRYGGGFGVLLLLVLLPVVMTVSQKRKERALGQPFFPKAEKFIVTILLLFCLTNVIVNGLLLLK